MKKILKVAVGVSVVIASLTISQAAFAANNYSFAGFALNANATWAKVGSSVTKLNSYSNGSVSLSSVSPNDFVDARINSSSMGPASAATGLSQGSTATLAAPYPGYVGVFLELKSQYPHVNGMSVDGNWSPN